MENKRFVEFWGLYIMGLPISDELWEYVRSTHYLLENTSLRHAILILTGAPDKQDSIIRSMVMAAIQ